MLPHFRSNQQFKSSCGDVVDWRLPHPIWSKDELENPSVAHCKPEGFVDNAAHITVMALRKVYDLVTGNNGFFLYH